MSAYSPQVKGDKPTGALQKSSHVYWRCKCHIVWTPKYRFKILKDKFGKELYRTIYILCGIKGCEVLELNVQPDHVHLVVIVPTKISISNLMGYLKGRSAIRLYNRFPHIRKKLWGNHFCSSGYFVDTVGVNEEIIRRYVRHQEKTEQTYEQQMELLE
ncbi:TPA: IS200/IS605 family transposase [Klebsiella oxytoca]